MEIKSLVILAAAAAQLTVVGCAHVPSRAECMVHNGSAWREVTSAHFRLKTNVDSKTAREAILHLERSRKALLEAWRGKVDPPTRLDAILFQSREQLHEFARRDTPAFFAWDSAGPWVVLTGESYAFNDLPHLRQLNHELAHYLSSYALLRQPRWLAEGLASYLEMTRPYGDGGQVRMGEVNRELLLWSRTHARVSWEDLWRWKGDENLSEAARRSHYATSWLWVHFLMNKHTERFAEFQARLGGGEEPRAAWNAAFAQLPHIDLVKEINHYLQLGTYSAFRFPSPAISKEITERSMADAEVHVVRARLWGWSGDGETPQTSERVKREVAEALASDPRSVDARVWQIHTTASPEERLRLARELSALHPDRAEAWRTLTLALHGRLELSSERREAAVKAVQLAPDDPQALNDLAWEYHRARTPRPGLPLARKAARLSPWSPEILDTWAALLADAGSCEDAALVQRRAVDMLREGVPAERRARYEEVLARYERGCKPEDAPPSAPSSDAPP